MRCWRASKSSPLPSACGTTISPSTTHRSGSAAASTGQQLGEVAVERLLVAARQLDRVAVAEHDAPEPVPLRLVEQAVGDGDRRGPASPASGRSAGRSGVPSTQSAPPARCRRGHEEPGCSLGAGGSFGGSGSCGWPAPGRGRARGRCRPRRGGRCRARPSPTAWWRPRRRMPWRPRCRRRRADRRPRRDGCRRRCRARRSARATTPPRRGRGTHRRPSRRRAGWCRWWRARPRVTRRTRRRRAVGPTVHTAPTSRRAPPSRRPARLACSSSSSTSSATATGARS